MKPAELRLLRIPLFHPDSPVFTEVFVKKYQDRSVFSGSTVIPCGPSRNLFVAHINPVICLESLKSAFKNFGKVICITSYTLSKKRKRTQLLSPAFSSTSITSTPTASSSTASRPLASLSTLRPQPCFPSILIMHIAFDKSQAVNDIMNLSFLITRTQIYAYMSPSTYKHILNNVCFKKKSAINVHECINDTNVSKKNVDSNAKTSIIDFHILNKNDRENNLYINYENENNGKNDILNFKTLDNIKFGAKKSIYDNDFENEKYRIEVQKNVSSKYISVSTSTENFSNWCRNILFTIPSLTEIKKEVDQYMEDYDRKKESERLKAVQPAFDEDGFTVVGSSGARSRDGVYVKSFKPTEYSSLISSFPNRNISSGAEPSKNMPSSLVATNEATCRKKRKRGGIETNFYKFQRKELKFTELTNYKLLQIEEEKCVMKMNKLSPGNSGGIKK